MPETQLEPHMISYSAAISACEKCEQWQKALALLWGMPEKQLEPHVISHGTAISACEKCEQWQKALAFLWELPEKQLEPPVTAIAARDRHRCGRCPGSATVQPSVLVGGAAWVQKALALLWKLPEKQLNPPVAASAARDRHCCGDAWDRRTSELAAALGA